MKSSSNNKPLAERVRPLSLEKYIGQEHLTADGAPISEAMKQKNIPSMILWGPPGVGKTTLAKIIGNEIKLPFYQLSAISAGVAEVRKIIEETKMFGKVVLFLDEIHRFNKSQQDALLGAIENGSIILIGATTENPSFEVNNALLSRCQVFVLKELGKESLSHILSQAIQEDELLKAKQIALLETDALFYHSGGDARKLLNIFEMLIHSDSCSIEITNESVEAKIQQRTFLHDKSGEAHYDIISAFIKSIRGSDPNAAVYWLARLIEGGDNPEFIARRLLILSSEDIGNANPNALLLATSTYQAVQMIGMPESRILLSQCATYLACSPKSNAAYMAINDAQQLVKQSGQLDVPLSLRNAPTKLMKELNYGLGYKYAHDYHQNFAEMEFLPEGLSGKTIYEPGNNSRELEQRAFLKLRWKNKYGY
jgi:putative ATPase